MNKRDFYKKETQFPSWRSRGCIGNGEGMDNQDAFAAWGRGPGPLDSLVCV